MIEVCRSVKQTGDKPYNKYEIEFYLPKNNAVPFLARIQEQIWTTTSEF